MTYSNSLFLVRPLLSVIIPTYERPDFLSKSIRSALQSAPDGCVEIVVVPNGPDKSWQTIQAEFSSEDTVHWFPIDLAGVSRARNHGLLHARGEFVRFLDDDDFLYKDACLSQYFALLEFDADVCAGDINVVSRDGIVHKVLRHPRYNDFCEAILSPKRRVQVGGYLYRREVLAGRTWNEERSLNEDMEWLLDLCASCELSWIQLGEPVIAWTQHEGCRLSKGRDPGAMTLQDSAAMIVRTVGALDNRGVLTARRRVAAADGLWSLLQKGLRYDFPFWTNIASVADGYCPGRRPPSYIHKVFFLKYIPPLFVEVVLIPIRIIYHPIRRLLDLWGFRRV